MCVTFEGFLNSYKRYNMAKTLIVLTRRSFSLRKALEVFPGACPVTDQHFNVFVIGLNMHFGFEKIEKLFIS